MKLIMMVEVWPTSNNEGVWFALSTDNDRDWATREELRELLQGWFE